MTDALIGLDIGGTSIKAGLFVHGAAEPVVQARLPTCTDSGPAAVVDRAAALVRRLVTDGVRDHGVRHAAVGVACLGLVDEVRGTAVRSVAGGWTDLPLRELLESALELPVVVGHDLRAAALAEAQLGAGRGADSFLLVAVGTGIGGAYVRDGVPMQGARSRAGEIGHLPVTGSDLPCGCGRSGCAETHASGRSIARRYEERTGRPATAAEVAAAADTDADAAQVWSQAVDALADVLAACTAVLDPELIVLGGGVALSAERLLTPLAQRLQSLVTLGEAPPILPAALGDRAAVVGAMLLAGETVPTRVHA